jgi:hypothetical protein
VRRGEGRVSDHHSAKMSGILLAVILFSSVGCSAPKVSAPPNEGYLRVRRIPDDCYGHSSQRSVVLSPSLETTLLSLVAGPPFEHPRCWYERSEGKLFLVAGDECGRHDEVTFGRSTGNWTMVEITTGILTMCHERVR